jgi:hypothetical protein
MSKKDVKEDKKWTQESIKKWMVPGPAVVPPVPVQFSEADLKELMEETHSDAKAPFAVTIDQATDLLLRWLDTKQLLELILRMCVISSFGFLSVGPHVSSFVRLCLSEINPSLIGDANTSRKSTRHPKHTRSRKKTPWPCDRTRNALCTNCCPCSPRRSWPNFETVVNERK